jgi:NADPH-dependent curcumin reductase CurA
MEGKLKYKGHVDQGLENAPASVKKLFTGENDGKLLIQIAPEPA